MIQFSQILQKREILNSKEKRLSNQYLHYPSITSLYVFHLCTAGKQIQQRLLSIRQYKYSL